MRKADTKDASKVVLSVAWKVVWMVRWLVDCWVGKRVSS